MGKSYRDLMAWQRAMDLVEETYRLTRSFPKEEVYGLTSQLRRAAVSIPSNIAEGQGRHGAVEFKHFLRLALGSTMELETQIMIAHRLRYIEANSASLILRETAEVGKMLNGLISHLDDSGNRVLATGY